MRKWEVFEVGSRNAEVGNSRMRIVGAEGIGHGALRKGLRVEYLEVGPVFALRATPRQDAEVEIWKI